MVEYLCLVIVPIGLLMAIVLLLAVVLSRLGELNKGIKSFRSELYRIAEFRTPEDTRAGVKPVWPEPPVAPPTPSAAQPAAEPTPQEAPAEPAAYQAAISTLRGEAIEATGGDDQLGQGVIELFVGRKLLAWVGMLGLLVASVLFIVYAHNRQWLSNELKTGIYVAAGLLLIGLGEWASRREWTPLARTLSGGGIAELLFASFSAMALYDLIGWTTFLVCIAAVVALGILLALRYDSLTISLTTTLSGMIAPLMLWEVQPDFGVVFAFLAAVNISVLVIAELRRWRVTSVVAFVGTAVNVCAWLSREHQFQLAGPAAPGGVPAGFAITVLGGFFALFLASAIIKYLIRRDPQIGDIAVFIFNPLWTYAATFALFSTRYPEQMSAVAAGLGVLYLVLTGLSHWRLTMRHPLYTLSLFYGVAFLVLAISMYFNGLVIPTMLAVLAAALYVAAETTRSAMLQWASIGVYFCTAIALGTHQHELLATGNDVVLNARAMTLGTCIASLAVTTVLMRRSRLCDQPAWSTNGAAATALVAHGLALALFTLEVRSYFATCGDGTQEHLAQQMVYSIGYAVYATGMLIAGFSLRQLYLRASALALFAVTLGKIAVYDVVELKELYRIASVFGLAVLLLAGAWLYNKYQHLLLPAEEKSDGTSAEESSTPKP
jgi:uncharacterized membrane protein